MSDWENWVLLYGPSGTLFTSRLKLTLQPVSEPRGDAKFDLQLAAVRRLGAFTLLVEAFEDVVALTAAVLLAGPELGGQTLHRHVARSRALAEV